MCPASSLWWAAAAAFAGADRVGVVVSDDLAVYRETAEAFLEALPEQPRVYQIHGRAPEAGVVTRELASWQPRVVVCVGAKAAYAVKAALPTTPIVYVAVRDPARYGLSGSQVTGVTMSVDPLTFVSQFVGFFPDVESIGVVRGPQTTDERAAAMVAAGGDLGKKVVVEDVQRAQDVRGALSALVDAGIDALWVPPDRAVLTTGAYRALAEEARRRHLPLLVDTASMVEAGGTFTMVPDPDGTARQALALVDRILAGASAGTLEPERPEELRVVLNLRTLAAAGLEVDELLLDFVDEAIE